MRHLGIFRFSFDNLWQKFESPKDRVILFNLEFSIDYKYVEICLLNFEFEIDW